MSFTLEDMFVGDEREVYRPVNKKGYDFRSYLFPIMAMLQDKEDIVLVHLGTRVKHLGYLLQLFPTLTIHCYFATKRAESPRIKYFSEFNDEVAASYDRDVFFVVNNFRVGGCGNIYVHFKNMSEKISRWYTILNPRHCLIKFFLPYPDDKLPCFSFLDGTLLVMPYTNATISYLIPNGLIRQWDLKEFDERIAHVNQIKKTRRYRLGDIYLDYDSAYGYFIMRNLQRGSGYKTTNVNIKAFQNEKDSNEKNSCHSSHIKTSQSTSFTPADFISVIPKNIHPKIRNAKSTKKNQNERNSFHERIYHF